MPQFVYIGVNNEHIVGIPAGDLSAEQYDALDYDHQQAVFLNRGSDGRPLYQEVRESPPQLTPAPELTLPAEPESTEPPADDVPANEGAH